MAEQSSSSKATREAPAQTVNNYYKVNAGVFYQGDHGTTHVVDSKMTMGGSHVTEHRANLKTPKAINKKKTSPPQLHTPLKMTAEQASLQREHLKEVFQDEIIRALADITSFEKFARSKNGLCLDPSDIKTIVEDHGGNVENQMLEMLFKWRKIQGEKATVAEIRHLLQNYFRIDNPSGYIHLENGLFGVYKTRFLCKKSKVYLGVQISEVVDIQTRAIKFVPKNKKILREAEILVKLKYHVNVVSMIHADIYHGDPDDYIYIVMERSWTQTVRNLLEECIKLEKPFVEYNAWNFVEQLMKAVEFLHSQNIIHRDLKPDNVLASDDWKHFKVTDYGLIKEIQDGSATNQTDANTGTEGYRSSETYKLKVKITVKVDIFSAGATIGEIMANGKHPFGENPDLWTYNIKNNTNPDLSHLCVDNKDQVISLIKPMLEMDPKKRPTAKEVLKDVSIYFQTFQLKNQQTTAKEPLATSSKSLTELSITEKVNAIIMFYESDNNSSENHSYSYNLLTKKWSQMQMFPKWDSMIPSFLLSGKHIYILQNQTVYQLEYSDPAAEWKLMTSMKRCHGEDPPSAVVNGLIYVCGSDKEASYDVERYDAALDRWDCMCDMETARHSPCVVATEDHIYCMGGKYGLEDLQSVERFDKNSKKWEFVESTPESILFSSVAVVNNQIYVTVDDGVLCYNIQNNSWSKTNLSNGWPFIVGGLHVEILAVDEVLYFIGIIEDEDEDEDEDEYQEQYAIYLLQPETEQITLVEKFKNKQRGFVRTCLAVKL